MIRNLVLKLPSLKCTSDYAFSSSFRTRNFRSLSPVQRARNSVDSERSVSCSRVDSGHIVDVTRAPRAKTLCSSKECYAQKSDDNKEPSWRDNPKKKEEAMEEERKKSEQFESLEQYELEAAKPRPIKNRDVFEAFANQKPPKNGYFHLQPSSLKPYGSQDNMYSPSLIRPTNLLKCPKKSKKKTDLQENDAQGNVESNPSRHRNYSTSSYVRKLSTSQSYIAKEGYIPKNVIPTEQSIRKFYKTIDPSVFNKKTGGLNETILNRVAQSFQEPWIERATKLDFVPPIFRGKERGFNEEGIQTIYKFSTPEMRRQRKENENRNRHLYYKSSYSDLIKLRLKGQEKEKLDVLNPIAEARTNKICLGCIPRNVLKSNQILQVVKSPSEQRTLTTRSKSNLVSNKSSLITLDSSDKQDLLTRISINNFQDQRNYSKSKSKQKKGKKKKAYEEVDVEAGCDICTPTLKALHKSQKGKYPLESAPCKPPAAKKKVFLPSSVKLGAVASCSPPSDYKDCVKVERCPPRADECLVISPKKLPKLPPGECLCVTPHMPSKAPKLKDLNLKFEDPPKVECHEPPCQTPRADDENPFKFKPLKPYIPGDCECIQPPGMKGVKLKRLPRCEPEEVCRPPRICPVIEKCPPRADECLKLEPKQLPPMEPSTCPCIDPPMPKIAPPLRKLDLNVPEPPRHCPRPLLCHERERADDSLKLTKKKLPKYVPGDCPCKDVPMTDWSPKRLICEEHQNADCEVPSPCKAFPRADWGCWEYPEQICEGVDEKCIEKDMKCSPPPSPPSKGHSCEKQDFCKDNLGGIREIRHVPKRRYSISTASLKLYEQVKSQNMIDAEGYIKTSGNYKPPVIKQTNQQQNKKNKKDMKLSLKKLKSSSAVNLVKMLNDMENSKKDIDDPYLFKPVEDKKINYEKIIKNIASSTVVSAVKAPIKEPKAANSFASLLNKPKNRSCETLKVTSRAISTSKSIFKNEQEIRKKKYSEGKKKCKVISRNCPKFETCTEKMREHRPSCKRLTRPICCEKEESPYPAFSDNLEESIKPFTQTPQWNCNRIQYGYYPNYKKEFDPLDKPNKTSKGKKSFSTCPSSFGVAKSNSPHVIEEAKPQTRAWYARAMSNIGSTPMSPKALLNMSAKKSIITTQNRTLSSKIFKIMPPPIGKPKSNKTCLAKEKVIPTKISCIPQKVETKPRFACKRDVIGVCKRRPPPFPAFSDCLDEEMEDILTECPLDKEKYLRMQPRFMLGPQKPFHIKPPPPIQGKLDLLKEEECLRQKLCIENVGLTQTCSDFGKPIPLMKTKKLIKEVNPDCERIEKMKKQGRWPPPYHRQKRRICTSSLARVVDTYRTLNTLGLNSISDLSKDCQNSLGLTKQLYTRNFHALVKSTDKVVLLDSETKLKELTRKMFPDLDESTKDLKLKKIQWNAQYLKNYDLLNRQIDLAKRARRYYTTYKAKRKNFLKRHPKGTYRVYCARRRVSHNAKSLKYKNVNLRGTRSLKTGNSRNSARRESSQEDASKRGQPKFTLNNAPFQKKVGNRKISESHGHRPPFPAFSERKGFSRSSKAKSLQPTYNFVVDNHQSHIQQFPEQDKIDRTLGFEYYKIKHGLKNEGTTLDCQSLGFCTKNENTDERCDTKRQSKRSIVDLFVQSKKHQQKALPSCKQCKQQPCACQQKGTEDECAEDRKKIEEICLKHCLKCIPCNLPEEEKYCVCREECKKIYQKRSEECQKAKDECFKEPEEGREEPVKCQEEKETSSSPPVPKIEESEPKPETTKREIPPEYRCIKQSKSDCSIISSSGQKISCPPAPCGPKKSKSITQLENLWQRIVTYFRARPNCPEPGEWKKKALKAKAEKAAKAAGLVALNPKCLPPDILRTVKISSGKDCKVCPNKDPCDKSDCETNNKSASPRLSRRKFSTVIQQSRSYSRNISSQNLEEINKLLEETEIKQKKLRYGSSYPNFKKEFAIFPDRKDVESSKAIKMSLDHELCKCVDLGELSCKDNPPSKTYFGYSDIIPSRENILERAWRISIESYNKYNCPKTYTFFNEFLNKIEKSIQNVEDLEKLKTENVLRELDEFLKNHDSDKNKK